MNEKLKDLKLKDLKSKELKLKGELSTLKKKLNNSKTNLILLN